MGNKRGAHTMKEQERDNINIREPLVRYIAGKKFSIHRRLTLLIIILAFLFIGIRINDSTRTPAGWLFLAGTVSIVAPIVINMFLLIPKFLFREKYLWYSISLISCLSFFYISLILIFSLQFPDPSPVTKSSLWAGAFAYFLIIGILCAATATIKLFQRWINDKYTIIQLENNLIHAELSLLKTNISPHFLFNMLNNSEVLIQTDPLKARIVLRKLSEFLRYQLYDSVREKVLLSADIRFLEHFLSLEKIRRDHFEFSISEAGTEREVEVSPLLFIPLLENAVKHGISSGSGSWINLSFTLKEQELIFTCVNPVPKENHKKDGGFGIPNLKRRLELLYPGRHSLKASQENDIYSATLVLKL